MNIKITGKDLKATEAIKEYVEKKCERLQKYTEDELDIKATIRTEGNTQVAEISTNINGNIYRAVSEQKDLYASIDKDIDIVEGQIRKMKTKKEKQMTSESIKDYEIISFNEDSHQVEKEVLKVIQTFFLLSPLLHRERRGSRIPHSLQAVRQLLLVIKIQQKEGI